MLLYIVRHGHPVYQPEEKLTDLGHAQAKALVPRMREARIEKMYVSPLRRTRETAAPTAEALGLEMNIEPWMSEDLAWARFTKKLPDGGETWIWYTDDPAAFVTGDNLYAGENWAKVDAMQVCPQAEAGYRQLQADSDEFIARLGYERNGNEYLIKRPNDDRIACFCHQGFGLTWLSHLLRIPPHIFWNEFDITHSGVTILEFKNFECGRTIPKCLCLSDMSHLFASEDCNMMYHQKVQI